MNISNSRLLERQWDVENATSQTNQKQRCSKEMVVREYRIAREEVEQFIALSNTDAAMGIFRDYCIEKALRLVKLRLTLAYSISETLQLLDEIETLAITAVNPLYHLTCRFLRGNLLFQQGKKDAATQLVVPFERELIDLYWLVSFLKGLNMAAFIRFLLASQLTQSHQEALRFLHRSLNEDHDKNKITNREIEVLKLLALGLSNKEIARQMNVALNTIKNHTRHIFAKLDVHNRVQAVAVARGMGIFDPVYR